MELKGKAALVTGGAVRLGKALALAIAERGMRVAVHYRSSAGPAEATVQEIRSAGGDAVAVQGDLSVLKEVPRVMERAVEAFGQIDVLVNSAAIFEEGNIFSSTPESWERQFALNLRAPFFLAQHFARQIEGRRGHIVNIADWRGVRPDTTHLAYNLTKAGLIAMTRELALALAPNIQVNAIAPGAILPPPEKDRSYLERLASKVPVRRVGSTAEIARTVIFLLESDFVTGDLIFVTGGQHL